MRKSDQQRATELAMAAVAAAGYATGDFRVSFRDDEVVQKICIERISVEKNITYLASRNWLLDFEADLRAGVFEPGPPGRLA